MKTSDSLSAPRVDVDASFDLFPGGEMVSQRRVDSLSAPRVDVDVDVSFDLFPGGEMVSQRTLNPLFLVRAQAWEREFMMRGEV